MPNWVTHLMIADRILGQMPGLDRRGFCVGSIGPDCNIENEDWSEFMPPREVTHWMRDGKKTLDGAEQFFDTYAVPCIQKGEDKEKQAFMFGYYAHLVTDALFPLFLRDADRVQQMWKRILADKTLYSSAKKLTPSWENARTLVTKQQRMVELSLIEAEYLNRNPDSGFMTEILGLESFPDYLDYLQPGSIVRKVRIMGVVPTNNSSAPEPIVITGSELYGFIEDTAENVCSLLQKKSAAALL